MPGADAAKDGLAAAWNGLVAAAETGTGIEAAALEVLAGFPAQTDRTAWLRDLVERLAVLANHCPPVFAAVRGPILAQRAVLPADLADVLDGMLADDAGCTHGPVIRRLVAAAELDMLKAVVGCNEARSANLLGSALDAAVLRGLVVSGRTEASFVAAVGLTAMGVCAVSALSPHFAARQAGWEDDAAGRAVTRLMQARALRLRGLATPALRRARLRVALCVSGQLRGWVEARESWGPFFQGGHVVETFVHSWSRVGPRLPHHPDDPQYPHYDRCFSGAFVQALNAAVAQSDAGLLERDYPVLRGWFAVDEPVPVEMVQDAYSTRDVVLEDDQLPPFAAMGNAEKMYSKVERCFDLAKASGRAFDVMVRVRPDKSFAPPPDFDWAQVHAMSLSRQAVLTDVAPFLHRTGDLTLGDQFACGAADVMAPYFRTASFSRAAAAEGLHGFPGGSYFHRNFAYTCLLNGVRMMGTPNLAFSALRIPPRITPAELLALLTRDVAQRPARPFDSVLLAAAAADLSGISTSDAIS